MKIAFIGTRGIPPNYGGSETYVEQLALQLVAQGDEVWVYGAPLGDDPAVEARARSYPPGIHRVEVPTLRTKHADNLVRSFFATMHVCLQRQIEIVQFINLGPATFAFLPRLFGKKVVGAIRALDSRREKWGPVAQAYLRLCERLIYIFSHATTTNSKAIARYYRERFQVDVHYTPNGAAFPDGPLAPTRILRWGLHGKDYLLFVGRLVPEKGCHTLIEAFRRISWPGMKLVFAGGESFSNRYAAKLKRAGDARVLFLGHVNGTLLEELYSNSYAFVLPSAIEGMSNALLSAMAHGRPVVVSDIAENTAVVEEGSALSAWREGPALVFRVGDIEDLAEKLAYLRDHPEQAELRGSSLQDYARTAYSWRASATETRRIFESLLR